MVRLLKVGIVFFVGTLAAVWLTGCVNVTKKTTFSLSSSNGQTTLNVYVARLGFHTNIHGGDSDSYVFTFPKGINRVKASQISHYFVNYKELPLDFSKESEFYVKTTESECEITLSMFSDAGVAFPVNGTYKTKYCGQQYL